MAQWVFYFEYSYYICNTKMVLTIKYGFMKVSKFYSSDTNVSKFVFEWSNPKGIAESVLYRYGSYRERTVICCSVQSGCPVGCTFCGTGKFFVRNLVKDEIVMQVNRCLATCRTIVERKRGD